MKDTNITFKLSEAEKEEIRTLAASKDIPMSQLIREALKKYFESENKKYDGLAIVNAINEATMREVRYE